jgi:hypothetical protein
LQCCQKNKVTLPLFHELAWPYPKYLMELLTGSTEGKFYSGIVSQTWSD